MNMNVAWLLFGFGFGLVGLAHAFPQFVERRQERRALRAIQTAGNLSDRDLRFPRLVARLGPLGDGRYEPAPTVPETVETVDGLWHAISSQPYTPSERSKHVPKTTGFEIQRSQADNHMFLIHSNKSVSPCPHSKRLHAFGAWARLKWVSTKTHGLIYDGLWQGDGTTVLARFSRNGVMLKALNPALDSSDPDDWFRTPPNADDIGTVTKFSIALKVCPDQDLRKCRDLVFLPHDSVNWEHGNLFAQVQHTNVTFDPQTTWAFGGWAADVGHIRLDHMGTTHPTVISLVPSTRFVGQYRPHRDWRTLFGSLKQGEVLYTMYDQAGRKIATLELDEARVVASEFGDTRVHFRHNMLPSITPIDARPVKLPRKIPPSWTSAPSLAYMLQKAIGARCGVDFNSASLDGEGLAEGNGLPTVLAPLLDVIINDVVHLIPSRVGSAAGYFVDSTQDLPDPLPPTLMTLLRNALPFSPELTLQANEQATFVNNPQYSQGWWRTISGTLGGTSINNFTFDISDEERECSIQAMRPMLEAMWEHRAAIERMVIREWQLWHRMGKFSLALSGLLQGKQNDDRFRNQLDIDNDVWLDPFGGELPGCVDDLKPRFS